MIQPHHPVPGLISGHSLYLGPGPVATGLPATMITQRTNEEERWLARQRKLRQEKEDRQYQVSEFRQQVLEQHLDLGRPADAPDHRTESHRWGKTPTAESSQEISKSASLTTCHGSIYCDLIQQFQNYFMPVIRWRQAVLGLWQQNAEMLSVLTQFSGQGEIGWLFLLALQGQFSLCFEASEDGRL